MIAQNLNIDKSTVYRVLQLFFSTETVSERQYPKDKYAGKFTDPVQLLVLYLAMERPSIKLQEKGGTTESAISLHSHFKHIQVLTSKRIHKTKLIKDCCYAKR